MKGYRWIVLGLLFTATVILYIDRSALGILAPFLQNIIGWSEEQYGIINSVFMLAYAASFLVMGRIIDWLGTRRGYILSIGIWSLAVIGQVLARTWIGFAVSRFSLGVGQAGNFPAAIRAVAEWFPGKDRALAVGIFNGGSNMGTLIAPLVVPFLVLSFDDWRIGFLWTFPVSLAWIILWWKFFNVPEKSRYISDKELDYIHSDNEPVYSTEAFRSRDILPHKGFWAIALAKFMADPVWWFYLFWGAKFLNEKFGVDLKEIGLPFFTIYLVSWGIGILLGWFSSLLMQMGLGLNKGRKFSLLACALFAVPVILVPHVGSMWVAVGLIALAAGGHCGWSANIFSLMADIFPRRATASVAGFGGFAGAMGGALVAYTVGRLLQDIGLNGYIIAFAIAGSAYFIALLLVHLLVPTIKPVTLK
jgi:ACS family hexuronate transporter-like MFS transporter